MAQVPSNLIPTRLTQLPEDPAPSGDGWLMYVRDGVTYKTQASTLLDVSGVPPTRAVIAGTGLTGGGALSSDVTLSVAPHGIGSSELRNTGVTAGVYGSVTSTGQLTVGVDGRVTGAVEVPSTPDMAQATGVLGLTNGGSGRSLVATPGAFVYTDGGGMQVMPQGLAGQVPISTGNGAPVWGSVSAPTPVGANLVNAGPVVGPEALPTFRALVAADLPLVDIAHGGTNATTAADARANLSAAVLGANGDITSLVGVTGGVSTADYVDFDTLSESLKQEGRVLWNSNESTLDVVLNSSEVTLQVGQETLYRVRNNTSLNIPDGLAVMASGTLGNSGRITVAPAIADKTVEAKYILGIATEAVLIGEDGFVTHFGKVRGTDTTGTPYGEVWADGDVLYVSPTTPGFLTKIRPSVSTAHIVSIAIVVKAHSNGTLFVRPSIDSHEAENNSFQPTLPMVSTNVQDAIEELSSDLQAIYTAPIDGGNF